MTRSFKIFLGILALGVGVWWGFHVWNIPITSERALQITRQHVAKTLPELDISQTPPVVRYEPAYGDQPAWIVSFAYPAPPGVGVRPYIGLTVYVRMNGKVFGTLSHSP